jgi:opacity protein-like surface antigen
MKHLLSIFFLASALASTAHAQDPAVSEPSTGRSGYGGAYDGRAEIFVTGFGLFSNRINGNAIVEQSNRTGGASAGYRFHLNASSALEGRYGFSRNSQSYSSGGYASSIPTYFSEISGSYIYSVATSHRVQPFLEGGGGVVVFSPANYGAGSNTPYGVPSSGYTGPSLSFARQARGMFVYGGGADLPASSHLKVRLEFRDVGYNTPDFGSALLHTNTFSFAYESSVGLAYRF